jgi:hypothetical protein
VRLRQREYRDAHHVSSTTAGKKDQKVIVSGGRVKMSVYARDEQLCDHHKRSSVRIYCAPLFHEFEDGSRGVQKDETLTEEVQVYDVAWGRIRVGWAFRRRKDRDKDGP